VRALPGSGSAELRRAQPRPEHAAQRGFGLFDRRDGQPQRGPGSDGRERKRDGGCSTVQAIVTKNGTLVDGAIVTVTTTLGVFKDGTEDLVGQQDTTTRGVATFFWCATDTRGTSTITASVEEATTTVMITIF
jgi:hypothetical protein